VPIWIVNTPTPATPQAAGARPRKAVPVALPEVAGGRNCKLRPYTKKPIPSTAISSEVIAYTSPDSTFAVTKRMFDGAKKSILIGSTTSRLRTCASYFSVRWRAESKYR